MEGAARVDEYEGSLPTEHSASHERDAASEHRADVVSELHNGITEACHVGFVALALAWVEEAARQDRFRPWAKAGFGIGLAAVASPYLGLGAGIAALVRGLPSLRHAWVGALTALAVAAPPALLLRSLRGMSIPACPCALEASMAAP